MELEWINCLTGICGKITVFPAEMVAGETDPGVSFRVADSRGVTVIPDFRAKEITLNGKILLGSALLTAGEPAVLRMGKTLLALCTIGAEEDRGWRKAYKFPLWTIFDSETFDALETVRVPADIPDALSRNNADVEECLVSPYGLPVCIPFLKVRDLLT